MTHELMELEELKARVRTLFELLTYEEKTTLIQEIEESIQMRAV